MARGRSPTVEAGSLTLTKERLILRPWRALLATEPDADADALLLRLSVESHHAIPAVDCAVVFESHTNDIVGSATMRLSDARPAMATIDYLIYPLFNDNGYAVDVVRMITDLAFERGAVRVELSGALDDLERARTALAAGFRYEGVLRSTVSTLRGMDGGVVFSRVPEDSGEPIGAALPALPNGGIGDGVITLRVGTADDAVPLHTEQSNPEARRWALFEPASESEMAALAARAGLEWLVGPRGLMVIVDNVSGEVAGRLTLRAVVPPHVADVGYGVLPAFRGRGYSARALRVIASWTFGEANYARLELGIKSGNAASRAAAISGGFAPNGTRKSRLRNTDGTFSDELHFALVNPRYQIAEAG